MVTCFHTSWIWEIITIGSFTWNHSDFMIFQLKISSNISSTSEVLFHFLRLNEYTILLHFGDSHSRYFLSFFIPSSLCAPSMRRLLLRYWSLPAWSTWVSACSIVDLGIERNTPASYAIHALDNWCSHARLVIMFLFSGKIIGDCFSFAIASSVGLDP